MKKASIIAAKLLKEISEELEKLSDEQLGMVESGEFEVKFVLATKPIKKTAKEIISSSLISPADVVEKVRGCQDRISARELIDSLNLTKRELQEALKILKISVGSSDNRDAMIERLISSTVGVRLRSEAIQSLGKE